MLCDFFQATSLSTQPRKVIFLYIGTNRSMHLSNSDDCSVTFNTATAPRQNTEVLFPGPS